MGLPPVTQGAQGTKGAGDRAWQGGPGWRKQGQEQIQGHQACMWEGPADGGKHDPRDQGAA